MTYAGTPNVYNAARWESPGTMPPPDSSSPLALPGANSSPLRTAPAPPLSLLSYHEITAPPALCPPCRNSVGPSSVHAQRLITDIAESNTLVFPTFMSTTRSLSCSLSPEFHTQINNKPSYQTIMGAGLSIHSPASVAGSSSSTPVDLSASADFAKCDICAVPTLCTDENAHVLGKPDGIDRVPTCHVANTTSIHEGNSSKPPFTISDSCADQGTHDGRLKRRRSSTSTSPKPKKVKLERTVSRIFCAGDASEPTYQATEPASLRRAQSLRSEISACSDVESMSDSLFYPSPLSEPTTSKHCDTVPSTPLPDSVDYARSKANPLARTIPVYRHRSQIILVIPPVPIIAPPQDIGPTYVYCPEDQAIDRLKALLHRECSERGTDGLNVQDDIRAHRLKAKCQIESAFARRDSASTTDTGDGGSQWEEESTWCSQGSQPPVHTVTILPMQGQHRSVDRETWSSAFGIENDLRKEVIEWILKKLPRKPKCFEEPSRDRRQLGSNLYDQLTNSPQTRFHATQLFLRYLRVPEKAEFWRDLCKNDCLEGEKGIWDLAVACIALGIKLHRDCLPPLLPVFSAEFLELAPHSMTHVGLECAQRDIMYTLQCLLGSCTPQDVLDELWNALPTMRKATTSIPNGWTVVQRVVWDKLFESLLEPDTLQYPVTLLTAAALVDGLVFALTRHFRMEGEDNDTLPTRAVSKIIPDDVEATSWQICCFEAKQLVENVILDIRDVLELSEVELNECRTWLSYVGEK
ncbi:hypothetical protein JVU11DRAFT_6799 [Chiua virens]|nr:hypothetical protein JVU11DRAFT_6799 [Chiua virens]